MNTSINYGNTHHVPYWNNIRTLGRNDRIMLINLLSSSLMEEETEIPHDSIEKCFGAWKAEDYSPEMLIHDIDTMCAENSDFINKFL